VEITPPIVVVTGPDCAFYRIATDAVAAGLRHGSRAFDALGQRLTVTDGIVRVSPTDPDGAEELAGLLRRWLGYMDALRGVNRELAAFAAGPRVDRPPRLFAVTDVNLTPWMPSRPVG
jgi:hypothetical protein